MQRLHLAFCGFLHYCGLCVDLVGVYWRFSTENGVTGEA